MCIRDRSTPPKDLRTRVQDLGEEALHKLAEVPGGAKLVEMANQSRSRLDEMQKRLRGLDVLERRVDELEQRLAKVETAATAKKAAARPKRPAAPKPPPA